MCFCFSALATSAVGVITLSSDATILATAVTSPTSNLELATFQKTVAQEDSG